MRILVLFLTLFIHVSVALANQDINIQNALDNVSNYEKRAQHAALLEELIKYNPSCFVASVKKLDPKSCEKIEDSYLNEPFFYPREDLRASLASAKNFKASCLAS